MEEGRLFIDTAAASDAADGMVRIAAGLADLSTQVQAALDGLAGYESPHSEEYKDELRRWIRAVGTADSADDPATMHGRMHASAMHLRGVADSYNG